MNPGAPETTGRTRETSKIRWNTPDRGSTRVAGREKPLFADDAVARLHRVSNGLPRALNNVATAALIAAAADSKTIVDDACAKKAAAELTRD